MSRSTVVVLAVSATLAAAFAMRHGATAEQQSRDGAWKPVPSAPNRPPGTFSVASSQLTGAAGSSEARIVEWDGKDLRTRLQPNDSIVEVVRIVGPSLMAFPEDPAEELLAHTRRADAVVVLRPTAVVGKLTDRADWVNSTVTADVVEILKDSPKHPLRVGSSIQVTHRGGEVTVEGKRIRAKSKGDTFPEPGQDYVYFLFDYEGTLHAFPLRATFGLAETGVHRLGAGNDTTAFSAPEFLTLVRERVALGRK